MRGKKLPSMMRCVLSITIVGLSCVSAAQAATEEVLHAFMGVTQRGANPQGSLVADAAGNLYGTSLRGGAYGYGTVFELSPTTDGKWDEGVLYSFQNGSDGANPNPGLVFDAAGNLFGTCGGSGRNGFGSVFELSRSSKGWTDTTLYVFGTSQGDGSAPNGSLVFDRAGNLYGTTAIGPNDDPFSGTVFELTPGAGGQWMETVIHTFAQYDGANPFGGVILDDDGNIYGTTQHGGNLHFCQYTPGCGTVFMLSRRYGWSETILHFFTGNYPFAGAFPAGNLTLDASGNLYGAAGVVYRLSRGSWSVDILSDFSNTSDGASPNGSLILDTAGNLYGTALDGANSGCDYSGIDYGCGTVFKLSPDKGGWKEHTLYRFNGGKDGGLPIGGVVLDSAGNLYGTASMGGIAGDGTVFRVSQQSSRWKESTIFGFTSSDGSTPEAGLVSDGEGNFYGTTSSGGEGGKYCVGGCGTVFKLTRDAKGQWSRSLLYSFKGGSDFTSGNDGGVPMSGLIFDQAGNLYGTTLGGGDSSLGTIYKISNVSGHWVETVLYRFQNVADGEIPLAE
jgi:uncharacterized repeat protein (TIGR03803 family)